MRGNEIANRSVLAGYDRACSFPPTVRFFFFCFNSFTSGITRVAKKQGLEQTNAKSKTVTWTNTCSDEAQLLGRGRNYCSMWYRKLAGAKGNDEKLLSAV